MRKSYLEKLRDPRWQKKRLQIFERDKFRCQLCWNDKMTLHVHHKYYKHGKQPWEYPLKAMLTLCEKHHYMINPKKIYTLEQKEEPQKTSKKLSPKENSRMAREMVKRINKQSTRG